MSNKTNMNTNNTKFSSLIDKVKNYPTANKWSGSTTITPSSKSVTIPAYSDKTLTVSAVPTQTKTISTLNDTSQGITPSSGKYLSKVTIPGLLDILPNGSKFQSTCNSSSYGITNNKLIYGQGHFICFGFGECVPTILVSTNGTSWQNYSLSFNIIDMIYGNGYFIALADDRYIYSLDNILNINTSDSWIRSQNQISFAATKLSCVGNCLFVSSNLNTAYTECSLMPGYFTNLDIGSPNGVFYDNQTRLFIIPNGSSVYTIEDLSLRSLNFNFTNYETSAGITCCISDNGKVLMGDSSGYIYYISNNLILENKKISDNPITYICYMELFGGAWVVFTTAGYYLTVDFNTVNGPINNGWNVVYAYENNGVILFAEANNHKLIWSSNSHESIMANLISNNMQILYKNGIWLLCASGYILYSIGWK